jgi:hypothetical protein
VPGIEDAQNLEQLGDMAQALYSSSFDSYQKVSIAYWETITGARPVDTEACAKNIQLWMGTVAKDLGTATAVWDKWMQILTKSTPGAQQGGQNQAGGQQGGGQQGGG